MYVGSGPSSPFLQRIHLTPSLLKLIHGGFLRLFVERNSHLQHLSLIKETTEAQMSGPACACNSSR